MKNLKSLTIFFTAIILYSCGLQKPSIQKEDSHIILEISLNELNNGHKSINFEKYTLTHLSFDNFKNYLNNVKIDSNIDSTWFNDFLEFKKTYNESHFDKWDVEMLEIKNLNSEFKLKDKKYLNYIENLKREDKLNERKIYAERIICWFKETGNLNIISAREPIFSQNGKKAILITSIYNGAITAWLFEKKENDWEMKLKKEVAMH